MRPFLLISPCFAPQSSVAAFRWTKLCRHLVPRGFRPIVLSGTFPEDSCDPHLTEALPQDVAVFDEYLDKRILSFTASFRQKSPPRSASNLRPIEGLRPFQSLNDRYWLHQSRAYSSALDIARRFDVRAVVISAGPFTAVPVAFRVAKKLDLPIVLDFRDPYGLHESGTQPPRGLADRLRARIVKNAEMRWMKSATYVVLNTRNALAAYQEQYPFITPKSSFIRNHYDLGLYDSVPDKREPPTRFTILHTGTLRAETRLDDIIAALRLLIERDKLTPQDIALRQIGRFTAYEQAQIAAVGLNDFIITVPPVPLRTIAHELQQGHVLLSMVDPRVRLRIAAKTYDYIASGMPIISVTENPEVDELLAHRDDNIRLRPGDIDGLVAALSRHLEHFRQTRSWPTPVKPPKEFSSEMAAERFAHILDDVMNARLTR